MAIARHSEFGTSVGRFQPIEPEHLTIKLRDSGINLSASASEIEEGESTNSQDMRFLNGGILNDFDVGTFGAAYAGVQDKNVMAIRPFELPAGTKLLMRIRPTAWDRWNGAAWLTLAGALTGTTADRVYTAVAQGKFVLANLLDRLKYWDGADGNAVADLSADAPIAAYIAKIGTRLVAARVKFGGVIDPHGVAWSADGNIQNWTTGGAGSTSLFPEGDDETPNIIRGMAGIQRGIALFRQRSIVLGSLTGIGSAPMKWQTIDFTHGTESPYSIASGGMKTGAFFLGYDYMPYLADGVSEPVPIGIPIVESLKASIIDLKDVVGTVDTAEQEYLLAFPTAGNLPLVTCWGFSIREWLIRQRLVWRRRSLPASTISLGFGPVAATTDPIVDTITDIVDTILTRVDDWGRTSGPSRLMFGDNNGTIWQIDRTKLAPNGFFESKLYSFANQEKTIDRLRIRYRAPALATVAIDISTDGGITYGTTAIHTLGATALAERWSTGEHGVTTKQFQFRIRPLTGFCKITEVDIEFQPRGRGND